MAATSRSIGARRPPAELARAELAARLRGRREEIETAALTRVHAVAQPPDLDPEYAEGVRAAIAAAIDYALEAIELGEERASPPPSILPAQARLAARRGIGLDIVLRRFFAGHTLFCDYLIEEVDNLDLRGTVVQGLLRDEAALFDRLVATVSEEHARERRQRPSSSEDRRAERIDQLLAGELIDLSGLAYEFEANHLALVAKGEGVMASVRDLASALDRQLLTVWRDEGTLWAWLGGQRTLRNDELRRQLADCMLKGITLAVGEPASGLSGWRLSHRQAKAALPIALRGHEPCVRYAEVALLASTIQDDLLATSLRMLYLEPLETERDGGTMARETLYAYFAADRNISSAAAALGVSRQSVAKRLRTFEERISGSLDGFAVELETALRLAKLGEESDSA